jgi:hypothetical protein
MAAGLGGCGVFIPEKHPLSADTIDPGGNSNYGNIENAIITHVRCEIAKGIWEVRNSPLTNVEWLFKSTWGTSVTLTLTFEDQSGLTPGASLFTPFPNAINTFSTGGPVTVARSFTLGVGASGTANATRTETIQFTYSNADLLYWAKARFARNPHACEITNQGVMITSDLEIDQFIYDKATIASLANDIGRVDTRSPPFNTFQEQITFVGSYGGNLTPTWKLARVTANPNAPLLSATRTDTDSLTITIGQITPATLDSPASLKSSGQTLHSSGVGATQIGTQGRGTSP